MWSWRHVVRERYAHARFLEFVRVDRPSCNLPSRLENGSVTETALCLGIASPNIAFTGTRP